MPVEWTTPSLLCVPPGNSTIGASLNLSKLVRCMSILIFKRMTPPPGFFPQGGDQPSSLFRGPQGKRAAAIPLWLWNCNVSLFPPRAGELTQVRVLPPLDI